LGSYRKI